VNGKIKVDDSILEVFDKDAQLFFSNALDVVKETFPIIWQEGIIGLTLKRQGLSTKTPIDKEYRGLRESSSSFPDFMIISNRGEELKAHKLVLAGQVFSCNLFKFSPLNRPSV
jgi:hypothetical protein